MKLEYTIQFGLGHTLDVTFARNLYNNIIVEKATYRMASGDVMYVYNDDKSLGRTIELQNLHIPKEYWQDAEKIPLHTTYYKLRKSNRVVYSFINVWDLIGKQIIACGLDGQSNFNFETSDGCEYVVFHRNIFNVTNFENMSNNTIQAVEVVKSGHNNYTLHLKLDDCELSIFGNDESVENEIREIDLEPYAEYRLYDSLKGEFVSNGTTVL